VGDANTDHRADLYAWGVMAYELLTGAHPFARHATAASLVAAHLSEQPAPIRTTGGIPSALASVVMKCLEKDPGRRPSSANELLTSLDEVHVSGPTRHGATTGARSPRWQWITAAAIGLVIVAGVAYWSLNRSATRAVDTSAVKSLAVRPFESVGGDTANAYFAEGIADALTTALAQLPGIRVAGRSSAARFRGRDVSAKEIGSALDVGSVLEGTVRRAGDRVRVTAQLTDAVDGLVVWTESYDREAKDVFALQDDITHAIVGALQGKLAGNTPTAAPTVGTTDPQAYDLYLRGLFLYRRRGPALLRAAELFEQAIAKDSKFARAHAALATTLLSESYYLPVRMGDVLARARAAAERAVTLDPSLSDAHQALAIAHFHAFEWEPAEREARRAVELDPASPEAHYRLGFVLLSTGRTQESIVAFEKARANDPLYAIVGAYLGYAHGLMGHADAAIAEGLRAIDVDSTLVVSFSLLARTYRELGRAAEAVDVSRRALALTDEARLVGHAANTIGRFGRPDESRRLLEKLEALPANHPRRNTGLALAYLGLGDTARALTAMERAVAGDGDLLFSVVPQDRTFDAVRSSARFSAILRRVGLDPAQFTRAAPGGK
jgi:serine/threonine-protein kinase